VAAAAVGWARLTLATPNWQFLVPGWLGLPAAFVLAFMASQPFGLDPFLWQFTLFLALFPGSVAPLLIAWQARRIERANLRIVER
jgi:hypothetical protein